MKNSTGLLVVAALSSILVSGCTSIRTRDEMLREKNWDIYPGVQRDVMEIGDAFSGNLRQPGWVNAIVAPILLVDLPISAVFDTVVLPYDLYRVSDPKAFGEGR